MALFIRKVTERASQRLTLRQRKSLLGAIQPGAVHGTAHVLVDQNH